ncbi:hypothetical protein [Nocardia fluminea]|uniref:Uncharacterized protein n=1 Tax=Nocardia fluminea TaxID=134984 RepID=A0A2N3WXP5_9NOCA|nr:hypothetical protein [Nocardia fluminea]PKV98625.1 hypothetical protein ATK86_0646 [Nocardia fluminea]
MNVPIEMTALCLSRPARGASAEALASWYAAKARLHDHLAGLGGPDSAREHELAVAAHRRAQVAAGGGAG